MKRWLSLLLVLLLACAQLAAPITAALAESDASAGAEEVTVEAAVEDDAGDVEALPDDIALDDEWLPESEEATEALEEDEVELIPEEYASEELVFDLGDLVAEGEAEAEEGAEEETIIEDGDADTAEPAVRYSRVTAEEAAVCGEDAVPFAWAAEGAVLLVLDADGEGLASVALDTDRGIVEGWTDGELLTPLTEEEINAYMDAAAACGPVSLYNDDINLPLMKATCRFAAAEAPAETEPEMPAEPEPEMPAEPEPEIPAEPEPEMPGEEVEAEADETGTEPAEAPEVPQEEIVEEEIPDAEEAAGEAAEGDAEAEEPGDAVEVAGEIEAALASESVMPITGKGADGADAGNGGMFIFDEACFSVNATQVKLAVNESWTLEAVGADGAPIDAGQLAITNQSNCFSVVGATVTGVFPGTGTITVAYGGDSLEISIQVLDLAESFSFTQDEIVIGEQEQYTALEVSFPADTTAQITYSSDDDSIASVDPESGVVTGIAEGSTRIIATASQGNATAECVVTVEKAPDSVALNASRLVMGEGDDGFVLTASVPKDAHQAPLEWSSNNQSVASIDSESGAVIANMPGRANITVATYNGKSATCDVTVAAAPSQVVLPASVKMYKGQKYTPAHSVLDMDNKACAVARLTFASSDTGIASVNSAGMITARGVGSAVITATAYNGVQTSMTVNVKPAVSSLKLALKKKPNTGYLGVGQTWSGWSVTRSPSDSYAYTYTYSSSNSKILKILDARTGKFKALKKGTAYIYVTSANGKKASCKCIVRSAPSRIDLSPMKGKLQVGKKARYRLNLHGAGGSYTFYSSNTKVATVTSGGKVTALKAGTTKITIKTYNGKRKTATLKVYPKSYAGLPGYLASNTSSFKSGMSNDQKIEYLIYVAQNRLGCRYVWGSFGPSRFDCSGFTYYCFSKIGVKMENSAYRQGYLGRYKKITKIGSLRRGDLVCFNTVRDSDRCDHVGIYLGNGYFVHASSSAKKVIISQFASRSSNYYQRNFSWGRRILG